MLPIHMVYFIFTFGWVLVPLLDATFSGTQECFCPSQGDFRNGVSSHGRQNPMRMQQCFRLLQMSEEIWRSKSGKQQCQPSKGRLNWYMKRLHFFVLQNKVEAGRRISLIISAVANIPVVCIIFLYNKTDLLKDFELNLQVKIANSCLSMQNSCSLQDAHLYL